MKKISALIVIMLCLLMLVSCGAPAAGNAAQYEATVLRINDSGSFGSAVQAIIRTNDLLAEYLPDGVTVEWTDLEGGANIRDGVVSGAVDCASFASATFISGIENGLPLVLLSNGSDAPAKLYSNNPDITSITDITTDSRISLTNKGTNLHLAFIAACKDEFGDPNKFDSCFVPMGNADAMASLSTSKDLDCALFSFPFTIKAEAMGTLTMIMDLNEAGKEYGVGSYLVANKSFYEKNPTLVAALNNAARDAIELMKRQPEETAKKLAELYNIDAGAVEAVMAANPPRLEVSGYDKIAGLLYDAGILDHAAKKFSELPNYADIPKAE